MKRVLAAVAVALAASPAMADEFTDTLNSALSAYNDGDIQYALEELTYAQELLNKMKSGAIQAFLPEAPEGWTREIDTSAASGLSMFGGGSGVAATYSNGSDTVTITIMMDNPMVTGLAALFSNPALMATQGKPLRVGREKFIDQDGTLVSLIGGRILVQAEGAAHEVMVPLLEKIDYRKLAQFGL